MSAWEFVYAHQLLFIVVFAAVVAGVVDRCDDRRRR